MWKTGGYLKLCGKKEAEMGARDKNCLWHLGGSRIYVELQPPWTFDLLVQLQTSLLEASCGNTEYFFQVSCDLKYHRYPLYEFMLCKRIKSKKN